MSDVNELSVFEEEEVVLNRQLFQTFDGCLAEVGDEVDMGFKDGYVRAQLCPSLA